MENDSGSEQSLSMNTARSELLALRDTAEEMAEHQRQEDNAQAVEKAQRALADLEDLAGMDRLSSQPSLGINHGVGRREDNSRNALGVVGAFMTFSRGVSVTVSSTFLWVSPKE